jgi:integrase
LQVVWGSAPAKSWACSGTLRFEKSTLLVQRGVVHGRVDDVKTEYSRDVVPIAPELATELLAYREGSYPTEAGWLFANPATEKPYHQEEIQKKHIRKAAKSASIKSKVGWKTFRHSYRSWLETARIDRKSQAHCFVRCIASGLWHRDILYDRWGNGSLANEINWT